MGYLRETDVARMGGDADKFEFVGVRGDDAQGVFADGASRAEQDDAFAGGGGHGGSYSRLNTR